MYRGNGRYVRQWSVDTVVDELERLENSYNLRDKILMFQDDVFAYNRRWTEEFCEKYKKRVSRKFLCYFRAEVATQELVAMMKDAGLVHAQMGVQSGSMGVRREYFKRGDSDAAILQAVNVFKSVGIIWGIDLLMENPVETEEDREKTLQLLLTFPKPFLIHTPTLTHFPGYELTNRLLKEGRIFETDVEDVRSESFEHNRWSPHLDPTRDSTNMFWSSLYHLAASPLLTKDDVIKARNNPEFIDNPRILLGILKRWPKDIGKLRSH
jgi:radical SAM superfamily enzyme YgiQ (UPF0313 family)